MRRYLCLLLLLSGFLFSCSSVRSFQVCCNPHSAKIYVDGVYVGNGTVDCNVPVKQKWVEISCTIDDVNFTTSRYYIKSIENYIDITISEQMSYSTNNNSLIVH